MSTVGQAVPLILVPRFTSYMGPGMYTTVPLDVSAYQKADVTVWRGPLVGDTGTGAAFEFYVQDSHDAETWERVAPMPPSPVISTVNTASTLVIPVRKRWIRVVVNLTADAAGNAAITCWATGLLEVRVR